MKKIDQAVAFIRLMPDESLANWIKRVRVCPSEFLLEDGMCKLIKCEDCWNEEEGEYEN